MNAFQKSSLIVGVVALVLVAVIGCQNPLQVGLGDKVDLDVPDVVLRSHPAGDYLSGTVTLSGVYTDDFEISGITLSFDGGVTVEPATFDPSERTWECEVITSDYPDGETEILLTITDLSGKEIQKKILYYFDNTAPLVMVKNPQGYATNLYNGTITVRGESADTFGIDEVLIRILDNAGEPLSSFDLADGTNAWVFEFDSRLYADPAGDIKLEAQATDRAGNQSTSVLHYDDVLFENSGASITIEDVLRIATGTPVEGTFITAAEIAAIAMDSIPISIDNDLDKPSVVFVSPNNGQNVGGSILVTGTAYDDDGIDRVEMRLDLNGDGDYLDSINIDGIPGTDGMFEVEADWETLSGTILWTQDLNLDGELYQVEAGHDGRVAIQVRAVDINALVGNPLEIAVRFDDTIPRVESLSHISGSYVSGTFTLEGNILDDERVDRVRLSYNGGISYYDLFQRGVSNDGSITENAANDLTMAKIIDTGNIPGVGAMTSEPLYLRLLVIDNASYQALTYITLNVDNVYPTGAWDSVAADPQEIDGTSALLQGTAEDAGTISGIGGVDVYFVRGTNIFNFNTGSFEAGNTYDFGDGDGPVRYIPTGTPNPEYFLISIDDADELGDDGGFLGDGDGYNESITFSGGTYDWYAEFDSNVISDEPVEIHYVVNDSAGNGNHYMESGFIKNNRPSIGTLTVGTDLNFDGSVTDGVTPPGSLDEQFTYSGVFAVRQRLYINIDATDPLGGIASYEVRRQSDDTLVVTDPSGGDYDAGAEVDVTSEVEGATVGLYALVTDTDGITARQDFDIIIDNDDAVNPSITLDAITNSSAVDGHAEAAGDSSYDNAPADADVSGTIALMGTASDDQRIQTIYLTIAGFDADGAGPTYSAGDEFVLAAWDAIDGRLEYSTILGYPVDSAVGGTLDPVTGHTAAFTYQWDSALITNSVATDVSIAVRGEDFGLATVDATGSTQVDVVPYISSVSTAAGIKDSNIRSMDGYYSIATSTTAATITINGYNLRPTASSVKISSDPAGAGGISLGNVVVAGDYKSVTTDANSNRSGYLTVISDVGPAIPSINNTNSNSLTQNEEDDTFAKNLTLTDDRYIRFFNLFETGIVNGYYADMMMEDGPDADNDPDLPTFGFVDDSAAFDLTLVRESVTNESPFTTVRNPLSRGLGWLQHGMGRDDGGSYFHVSTYNFSTGHQILFHDTYAKDYEFVASGVDGGFWAGTASPYWTGYTGNYVQNTNNDAIQMDWNQYAPGSLLNRYLVPKVFAKGDSLTGNAQVYLSFYDANEGALIFRNFQIGQTASPNRRGMNDAGQSNLSERTNVASGDPSRWSVTTSANNHFDMVVTDNDEVVFIYFNQAAGRIELIYTSTAAGNTTPASVTGADPRTTVNFSAVTQINQSFTGTYLSATIETDGVGGTPDPIHIAAHDSANGDLIYIKLDSLTDTTPEIVTVDQHLSVGILTDIEVNDSGVPYITYYNNSENGTKDSVKLAWYKNDPSLAIDPGVDGSGNVTGDWEAMTVPVIDTPNGGIVQFQRVNLDFEDLDNTGAGINLSPVVGYLADDLEYAKILSELP